MGANNCAYLGCSGFPMSQCARCQQHYCQRHKALLDRLCIDCQAAKQRTAPKFLFAGVVVLFLAFAWSVWVHGHDLGSTQVSLMSLAPVGGILGSYVVGLMLFSYGWLNRR